MQISKGRKETKNGKLQENQKKQGRNQIPNYQKGLIRNMCVEIPKNCGKPNNIGYIWFF